MLSFEYLQAVSPFYVGALTFQLTFVFIDLHISLNRHFTLGARAQGSKRSWEQLGMIQSPLSLQLSKTQTALMQLVPLVS